MCNLESDGPPAFFFSRESSSLHPNPGPELHESLVALSVISHHTDTKGACVLV